MVHTIIVMGFNHNLVIDKEHTHFYFNVKHILIVP